MASNDYIKLSLTSGDISNIGNKLFSDSDFSDVTLVCEDNQHLPAHRAVLCASSSFLRQLLYDSQQQRTFLYLGLVAYKDMLTLLELVYLGYCSLQRDRLEEVQAAAALLGISWVLEERNMSTKDLEGREEVTKILKWGEDIDKAENIEEYPIYKIQNENTTNPVQIEGKEDFKSSPAVCHESRPKYKHTLAIHEIQVEGSKKQKEIKGKERTESDPGMLFENEPNSKSQLMITDVNISSESFEVEDNKQIHKDLYKSQSKSVINETNKKYRCNKCDFVSEDGNVGKNSFERHRVVQHGYKGFRLPRTEIPEPDISGRYSCNKCDFVSRGGKEGKYFYRRHRLTKHEGFSYNCNLCDDSFKTRNKLTNHNTIIHNGVLFECKECLRQFSANKHLEKHQKRKRKCEQCDFFSCYKQVLKHFATNHNRFFDNGLYKCDQCSYQTTKQTRINEHLKLAHEATMLVCDQCIFQTKSKYELKKHRKEKHLGITYQCDLCKDIVTEFHTKNRLFVHKVKEHGLRNYPCKDCDYVGKSVSKHAYHREIKHPPRDYICSECNIPFASRNTLMRHVKTQHTHEPKACDKCSFIAKNMPLLRLHINTKHLYVFHQCTKCSFKAKLKSLIKSHEQAVHQGLSFDCEMCGKSMKFLRSLEIHRKNVCGKIAKRRLTSNVDDHDKLSPCEFKDCCRLSL